MALFNRDDSILLLIDYQDKMIAGVKDAPTNSKLKYTEAVVRAAAIVGIPVVLATIDEQINGPFSKDLLQHVPDVLVIQRAVPGFNALDDPDVYAALKEHVSVGRTNIIVSGLWSSMCDFVNPKRDFRV